MPIRAQAPDGSIHEFPDGTPDEVVDRVMKNVISVGRKKTEYNDAVLGGDNATASKLYDELVAVDPEGMAGAKKDNSGPDFWRGVETLGRGIADVVTGKGSVEAATKGVADFGAGALGGVEAAGRGLAGVGGQLSEDVLINAPITAIDMIDDFRTGKPVDMARSFSDARQAGERINERINKERPVEKFIGEAIGYTMGGRGLSKVGVKGIGAQGGVLGAAHGLGNDLGDDLTLNNPGAIATDSLVGIVGGKAGEAIGNAVSKPIAYVIDKFSGKGGDKVLKQQALDTVQRLKMSAEDLQKAQFEAIRTRGSPLSVAELANEDTVRVFNRLAYERDSIGRVANDAQEAALASRPQEMASAIEATGPSANAVTERAAAKTVAETDMAAVNAARKRDISSIRNARDEELMAAADGNADALEQMRRSYALETADTKELQRLARAEVTNRVVDKNDITGWGTSAMRKSGLSEQLVTVPGRMLVDALPDKNGIDIMKAVISSWDDSTAIKGRVAGALKNASEGGYFQLNISDADVLRKALVAAGKKSQNREFAEMAKAFRGMAQDQVPAYGKFLKNYAAARTSATELSKINRVFGKTPNVVRMAEAMANDADVIIASMGDDGVKVMESLGKSMQALKKISDELDASKNLYRDAVAMQKSGAKKNAAQIRSKASRAIEDARQRAQVEADKINRVFADNKAAISAARRVMNMTNSDFAATVSGAGDSVPVGAIARGAVADTARQNPTAAIKVAKELAAGSTPDRVASVAGKKTGDTLRDLGRVEVKAARNLNNIKPGSRDDKTLSGSMNATLDALGGMAGRMGPGYKAQLGKKAIAGMKRFGMSEARATRMAQAIFSRDWKTFDAILQQAYKSEASRLKAKQYIVGMMQALVQG